MSFEVLILGSNGGPVEQYTSSVLVKSAGVDISPGCFVCVDAGTLASAIESVINTTAHFPANLTSHWQIIDEYISTICITHPHMDHIAALVVNSAGFGNTKRVLGTDSTIDALKRHVFNGTIWPNLDGFMINLETMRQNQNVATGLTATHAPINHAPDCPSTVFILTNTQTGKKMLVFGDVEPDAVTQHDKHNTSLWSQVSSVDVVAILIECSFTDAREGNLYGHMTPQHLSNELSQWSRASGNDLNGVVIIVTHVKTRSVHVDPTKPPHCNVISQLQSHAAQLGLRCKFELATHAKKFSF